MSNFITKYHDSHKLNLYRLIKMNETANAISYDIIKDVLNNIGIDLLCVATHYSEQYTNADNYLKTKTDDIIKNYVLYFEKNELEKIVDEFISQCIEPVNNLDTNNITWKNMHYIWKLYLTSFNIPNMIYSNQLSTILSEKIENINDNGITIFTNVTSKYLPNVKSFLSFWEKHITVTNDNNLDDEYEIDEFSTLYKNADSKNSQISDVNMIKMICHYFSPQVEVIDNKYITNIRCNLWSKQDDINEFLNSHKVNFYKNGNSDNNLDLISFDELYKGYKLYFKAKGVMEQKFLPIVSKHFFEKFLTNQLSNYIKFEKFVSSVWVKE
jgi:hypothetical protein